MRGGLPAALGRPRGPVAVRDPEILGEGPDSPVSSCSSNIGNLGHLLLVWRLDGTSFHPIFLSQVDPGVTPVPGSLETGSDFI